jgi:hypothetical protein
VLHSHNNLGGLRVGWATFATGKTRAICARNRPLTESSDPVTAAAPASGKLDFMKKAAAVNAAAFSMGSRG